MTHHWSKALPRNACRDALAWAYSQPSANAAWNTCERGDWMLWVLGKLSGKPESASRKKLVLAACACARLALIHVPKGEDRPLIAIETAERYARGKGPTLHDVKEAAYAAAATAASTAAATDAATAAYAATAAAAYAAYAAYAATAATTATAAAYAAYARTLTFKQCADIVRTHYPQAPQLAKLGEGA